MGARELANIAYGVARSGMHIEKSLAELINALSKEAQQQVSEFKARELANTA